jgi:hypothetical protein
MLPSVSARGQAIGAAERRQTLFRGLIFAFFKTCSRSIACAERAAIAGARIKAVHRNSVGALECF